MDAPRVNSPGSAHPPEMYDELRQQGIRYAIDTLKLSVLSQRAPYRLPDQVRDTVAARAQAILYLMRTRTWDVLMAVFVTTDRVQHCYWPDLETAVDHPSWNPVRALYQQLDAFLADALGLAGDNTTVLIISDHGFTRTRGAARRLNPLLARLELLGFHQGAGDWRTSLLRMLLRQVRRILPYRVQYPLAKAFPRLHLRASEISGLSAVAWAQTQAYAVPHMGEVYINLEGQGSEGTAPSVDYHTLRERVADILSPSTPPGDEVARPFGELPITLAGC